MEYQSHGMSIFYESMGSGLPIIMIHGWGPDHRSLKGCMEPLFADLKGLFRRIYFDLPGLGKTKGNEWLSSTDRMLELVMNFIEGVIPNQAFLLAGESYGGYLARGIAKKRPTKIKGLLLKCPLARNETQFKNAPPFCVLEKDHSLLETLSDEEKSYFEPVTVRQTKDVWLRFKEEVLPGLKIADHAYINSHWGKLASYTFDVDNLEYPLEKPVLILMGKQDSIVGYSDSWDFLKNYPRASFVVLDKAGHNLQIEQPELFNCLTKEWLQRVIDSEKKEGNGAS
jgi:Predicted hydrolases or acyltransferases (alpha/beta hydrolase superfamily)